MEGNNRLPRHYTELKGKKRKFGIFQGIFLIFIEESKLTFKERETVNSFTVNS